MKFGTGEQTMEVEIKQLLAEKSFNIVMLTIQYNAKDLNT